MPKAKLTKKIPRLKAVKNIPVSANSLVIVGIGASAGGLEALRQFVAALPLKANMAYVIAQHMSPHHRSMMVDLLSRETKLSVYEVKHDTSPNPDTIYVAPPNSDVSIKDGKLHLRKPLADLGAKPSVDYLFSSMAEDLGERAIGVVMSGTGADGSHGIRAINSAGGISIAQDPKSAKYDSMPVAAIKAGADLVLSPDEIASQLMQINARPRVAVPDPNDEQPENPLDNLVKLIYQETKMDFSNYKEATITRQIERRMAVMQMNDLTQYIELAKTTKSELTALASNFLICVTSFFRDKEPFDLLREELQYILKSKKPGDNIRIWVPGCATGEEAYTIAIILAELLGQNLDKYKVQVFATDANPETTQFGRRGLYPETSIEGVSPELLKRYFVQKDRFFQVDRKIRDLVVFANQDLVQDPPFVRVDAVSCRNLLIYFKPNLQDKIFRIFHYALNPDGIMLLGKSESIGHNTNLFSEIDRKLKVFRKNNVPATLPDSTFMGAPLPTIDRRQRIGNIQEDISPSDLGKNTLFSVYAPPSVLVTVNGDILEIYGDLSLFTQLKPGKADFSLFAIVHPPLRTELRAIVQKVVRTREVTYTHPIPVRVNGEEKVYRSVVRPLENSPAKSDVVLVSFEPMLSRMPGSQDIESLEESAENRISELEHELTITRESLQTVIEELETSNEELQSMNEEAQAANEELQASNEELETSNEELQATNEELTTVNDELSTKTAQLAEALDDMEIIQNSSDRSIVVVDSDLNIRRFNSNSFLYMKIDTAFSQQNLTSVPLLFTMENFVENVHKVSKTGISFSAEFMMENRYCILEVFPYKTDKMQINGGAVINIFDITDRAQAEKEIRDNESRFRSMVENAGDAIYIHDRYGRIYDVNQVACDQTGYSKKELLNLSVAQLDAGIDFANLRETWDLGVADPSKYPVTLESAHRRKDRTVFPMEVRISLLPFGEDYRYVAVVRDTSVRAKIETELASKIKELDFQKSALDKHAIVSISDRKGIITYINDKFCEISGYSREELIGNNHSIVKSGDHTFEFYNDLWKTITSGNTWNGEFKNKRKDGTFYWVDATIVPFPDESGKPFQYIAIRTDITERVLARSEAEKANQAKSSFLSSMSHELRTPLNAILGFSQLMDLSKSNPLTSDKKELLGHIISSGKYLLELINEVLDLSTIEAGKMQMKIEDIVPGEILSSSLSFIKEMAKKQNIRLEIDESIFCTKSDMPCKILIDRNRFMQIILNLLSNAVKYNRPDGTVKLSCDIRQNGMMRFTVSDTGRGIPENLKNELFQPFNRLNADGSIEGTGIGLTITQKLVEAMNGNIGFSSIENKGSDFWVEFVLSEPDAVLTGPLKKYK